MSTEIIPMDRETAEKAAREINESVARSGFLLLDFRDRQGWRALGYESFKACCEKEFAEIYGGKSHIYRLIQQSEVSVNISTNGALPVPTSVAREIAKLPAEKQKDAYEAAGGTKATAEAARKVVEDLVTKKPEPKTAEAAKSSKYEAAVDRIHKVCGKDVAAELESGVLANVDEKEAIFWAGLKDAKMREIQELVVAKRWTPHKALAAVEKMPTSETTVEELNNLCIAAGGAWDGTIGGFYITVKQQQKRNK